MISHATIEDLKSRCNIEDVISSYVTLKRAGSNLKGLCPFHSEKTPSFTVFPSTQNFYCFGCGAGGDVISFVMRAENLEYRAAIEQLAARAGITLPDNDVKERGGISRTRILEMNVCAARFFRDMLYDEREGAPAREYLEKRKLSSAIVRRFGLGYAPKSFDKLKNHLRKNGYTEEEMLAGYLCLKSREKGNTYDCFRGRLMFPIIDVSGNIVAFGGRVLDDSQPKYLNSSDTPAFKKSKHLFALNYARTKCAERLILCEGYMDVIQLHAAGFENAVATLGTAITPEHARIMKKYSPAAVISYDSDEAGQRAADKALHLLEEAGVEARVIKMDGAKDPDEFIKKFGASAFSKILAEGRSKFDFRLDGIRKKYDFTDPEQKIKAVAEMCEYIAGIYSRVEREVYAERTAKIFTLDVKNVKHDIDSVIRKRERKQNSAKRDELLRVTSGISDRVNRDFARQPKIAALEETVLGMMLLMREYVKAKVGGRQLIAEDFTTDYGRRLFKFILEAENNGGFDIGMLSESFNQDEVSRAVQLMTRRQQLGDNGANVFSENALLLMKESEMLRSNDGSANDIISVINRKRSENKNNV